MSASSWNREGALWAELSSSFEDLTTVLQPGDARLSPEQLVQAAQRGVPHADAAGLTVWPRKSRPGTIGPGDSLAHQVDQIQYELLEGPCLDAAQGDDLVRVDDLVLDERWPRFSAAAVRKCGIRSMFSVQLNMEVDARAAINFYAREPQVFSDADFVAGAIFATFISLALEAEQARSEAEHLRLALQSNRRIGMATGILMARGLLTSEQAFEQVRRVSQHLNRKLRDVADYVVETGQLPPVPAKSARQPVDVWRQHSPSEN